MSKKDSKGVASPQGGYYLLDPGWREPSVLYEVRLKEVKRMPGYTAEEIVNALDELGVRHLIVDGSHPSIIDSLRVHFRVKKILRR